MSQGQFPTFFSCALCSKKMQIKIKKLGGGTFEVDVDSDGTVSLLVQPDLPAVSLNSVAIL